VGKTTRQTNITSFHTLSSYDLCTNWHYRDIRLTPNA